MYVFSNGKKLINLHGKLGKFHEFLELGSLIDLKVGFFQIEPALPHCFQTTVHRGAEVRHPRLSQIHLHLREEKTMNTKLKVLRKGLSLN